MICSSEKERNQAKQRKQQDIYGKQKFFFQMLINVNYSKQPISFEYLSGYLNSYF